jgi:hypothetical protein
VQEEGGERRGCRPRVDLLVGEGAMELAFVVDGGSRSRRRRGMRVGRSGFEGEESTMKGDAILERVIGILLVVR